MPGRPPLRSEPPLGGWPGLARAAGALTQPQPAQPGLGSAPRATDQHAPQRAHRTASPGKHCGRIPGPCGAGAQRGRGTGASRGARWGRGVVPGHGASRPAARRGSAGGDLRRLEETRRATRGRDPFRWHGALSAPGCTGEAGRRRQVAAAWGGRGGSRAGSALQQSVFGCGARVCKAWKSAGLCSKHRHSLELYPLPSGSSALLQGGV